MICRYKLNASGQILTFGNECLKNWDDIAYALKRSDYGGTMQSFSSSFQFVGAAYDLIIGVYMTSYLNANCTISVYTINEDQSFTLLYKAKLDFGSMSFADGVLSINSFDDSIATLLNTKKSTQYEYPVSELREESMLHYDGLELKNEVVMTMPPNNEEGDAIILNFTENGYYTVPLYSESTEIVRKNEIEVLDQMDNLYIAADWISKQPYVFKNNSDKPLYANLRAEFKVTYSNPNSNDTDYLYIQQIGGDVLLPIYIYTYKFNGTAETKVMDLDIDFVLYGRMAIQFFFFSQYGGATFTISDITVKPTITWSSRRDPVDIDVIKPVRLLENIISSINTTGRTITCEIETGVDSRLDNAMIVAAESARGLENAKIYASWNKFSDWMAVMFGFVPVIGVTSIKFVHRDSLYSTADAVDLEGEIKDFEFKVDDGIIYSSVKVGYEKKDYDSVNGRDEFRWTNEFDTGIDIKSNTLDLISPYRADAYGIEFLVAKRGEETSDTDSDTDVFFVGATSGDSYYTLDRSVSITGVISTSTMFNAMYSPRSILKANSRYIGSSVQALVFASSDGNSDVTVGSEKETSIFMVDEGLFTAAVATFTASSAKGYDEDTLLRVSKDGKTFTGYLNERTCKYGKYDGVKYELLIKSIE